MGNYRIDKFFWGLLLNIINSITTIGLLIISFKKSLNLIFFIFLFKYIEKGKRKIYKLNYSKNYRQNCLKKFYFNSK